MSRFVIAGGLVTQPSGRFFVLKRHPVRELEEGFTENPPNVCETRPTSL